MEWQTIFSAVAFLISVGAIIASVVTHVNHLGHLKTEFETHKKEDAEFKHEIKENIEKLRECVEITKRNVIEIDARCKERYRE